MDVTALGAQVVEHARTMLGGLQAIRALVDDNEGVSGARIRLATFSSIIWTLLPALLRDFPRRHPVIEMVVAGTDEEVEKWLDAGAVDVGVVMNPAPARSPLALGSGVWVAVFAQTHPLGRRATERGIAPDELAAEPFILATGGRTLNGRRLMEDAGLQLSDGRITVRNWASACVLVREGLGVSLVPESTLPADRWGCGCCLSPRSSVACSAWSVPRRRTHRGQLRSLCRS